MVPACEEIIEVSLGKRRELRRKFPKGFIIALHHVISPKDATLFKSNKLNVIEMIEFSETVTDL